MSPSHFFRIWLAELRKTFTRSTGIGTVIASMLAGLAAVAMYHSAANADYVQMGGHSLAEVVTKSPVIAAGNVLLARSLFVAPLFLTLCAASSIAGEHSDRTLREVLVRPVPRWAILLTRLMALSTLSALSLVVTFVTSFALAVAWFGLPDPTVEGPTVLALLGGFGAAFLADVGLLVWAMAFSLFVRSVGLVVVFLNMILLLDFGVYWLLYGLTQIQVHFAQVTLPFTLTYSLRCWAGWNGTYDAQSFLMLGLYTAVAGGLGMARFSRLDAP